MDTTLTDPMVGVVLDGRYRIDDRLARGGMSTVYVGTDLRLDRVVAIKVMAEALAGNPTFVDKFTREARAAARLSHINVVAVFDQGSDQGHAFLVMELVRGHTLRDLLNERGRLTPAEAVAVLEPVLAGLTAAHRTGIIHRDIKPENVLLSDEGVVKVADFGLARAVAASSVASQTGDVLIGTVAYLSPEQIERGTASPRSDVYSAGIVLFEMLTGDPPYSGETAISVAYRHVHSDVPPPSATVPTTPPQLDELTAAATRRDPAGRPLDAGAFLAELWDVRTDLGLPRVPIPARQRKSVARTVHPTSVVPKPSTRPVVRPQRRRQELVIGLVLVLLLGLVAAGSTWWFTSGRYTMVPALVSLTSAAATDAAQSAGIDLRFGPAVFSEEVAADHVIAIDPPDGTRVVRGSEITATTSKGPERFTVDPGLVGQPLDATLAALNGVPLTITQEQAYDETVPAGSVVGFDPEPGTELKRDDPVTVTVSRGPAPVDVPNVAGLAQADAEGALTAAHLTPAVEEAFSDDVEKGLVISQSPTPDAGQVAPATTVTITVSKGVDLVEVPNVKGKPLSDAEDILRAAGFDVSKTCFLCSNGNVSLQDPEGGQLARRGSTVSILATF